LKQEFPDQLSFVVSVGGKMMIRSPSTLLTKAGLIVAAIIVLAAGPNIRAQAAATPPSPHSKWYAGFPVAVGQVGPIAPDNPREEPFACETQHTDLGQPAVDNQNGIGYPVTNASGDVIGYSANCGAPTIVEYFYLPAGSALDGPLEIYDPSNPPSRNDVATANIGHHHNVPVIIRYEIGTINRFIYAIAVLTPRPSADLNRVDLSAWNHNLIFMFGGGVGIGYDQAAGGYALGYVLGRDGALISPTAAGFSGRALLEEGYALVSSTGTVTATTYNLRLTGETATMIKEQFITRYGRPHFTFAIGGSGGAIQQTVYAQDFPGLLDGLIPSHPYPDMITQINPVGDCELAEFYFDVSNAFYNGGNLDPLWLSWPNRSLIEGMAGINGFQSAYAPPGGSIPWSPAERGSDECIEGWYGLTPEVINPQWPEINPNHLPESEMAGVHWDYYDDLKHIFGVNPDNGYAYNTFDNVGVQYGLLSLIRGEITPTQFIDVNAGIGGWMKSWEMPAPGFPFDPTSSVLDFWSQTDAFDVASPGFTGIAPRTVGDPQAMENAYRSGLVFLGAINNPIINLMAYLEPQLNMHSSREVFAIRQRLINARGNAYNQVIWGLPGIASGSVFTKLAQQALGLETSWLTTGKRPAGAMDACFDINGNLIAEGPHVWDGEMNGNPSDDPSPGPCTQQYPIFSSSRLLAGDRISEMTFKCALKPVSTALTDGTYGNVTFSPAQAAELEQIFPDGVCDYSQPDQGRPDIPLGQLINVIHNYVGE
jgi:Tannase-like family of unknown function (DUF6351)